MGSYEEFKTLAEAAFAKMIVKPREQEVPDSEAPEFTQLVDFLDKSDQRNEFLQKLVKKYPLKGSQGNASLTRSSW